MDHIFINLENNTDSMKIKKSDYIKHSKAIIKKLYIEKCYGKGSVYIDVLKSAIPKHSVKKVDIIIDALIKQGIIIRKKKQHGWKYYLNKDRFE